MVYRHRVGVDKTAQPAQPKKWRPTIWNQDLPEKTPKRVDVEGSPILLYRYQGQIYAMGTVC